MKPCFSLPFALLFVVGLYAAAPWLMRRGLTEEGWMVARAIHDLALSVPLLLAHQDVTQGWAQTYDGATFATLALWGALAIMGAILTRRRRGELRIGL